MHTVLEGPIRQVGFVVRDLQAALKSWCSLGVGPWYTTGDHQLRDCWYRGDHCEPTISVAFASSGPMQIELIQPVDDTPSIYREFLDAGHEGYQQLAWWVRDFDAVTQAANAAGWSQVFRGDGVVSFAYYETDPIVTTIVEVAELNDAAQGLADLLDAAAADWDGVTDPVRPLPRG
ncbi:MAG: VOC family protein [Actinobacteria bacterium]|nr:VOC family protein [Actinomycetota bacterium]